MLSVPLTTHSIKEGHRIEQDQLGAKLMARSWGFQIL